MQVGMGMEEMTRGWGCVCLVPVQQEKEESSLRMRTERKKTKRKVLSFLLSVALLVSMLPTSGGQVAKAADECPVIYSVEQDSDGNDYVNITGMADDYGEFIVNDTLTIPSEIEGKPVKKISDFMVEIQGAKKIIFPDVKFCGYPFISTFDAEEIYFMYTGILDDLEMEILNFMDSGDVVLKDIYFYPYDINEISYICIFDDYFWSKLVKSPVTIHVASPVIYEKINADANAKKQIDEGRLIVVQDLELSGEALIMAKRSSLAKKIAQGEALTETDYTKATWPALTNALAMAKEITEESDEAALDGAIAAMDAAMEGLISLEPIKKALQEASYKSQHPEGYIESQWQVLQDAIAAAEAVPDDATKEMIAELAEAVTKAEKEVRRRPKAALEISWKIRDNAPMVPPVKIDKKDSKEELEFWYYQDEACQTPAVGQDASTRPTAPGTYYLRATCATDGYYLASTSNVLQFTITVRKVSWNGYQWDGDTGELTITEDMVDFPDELEVPWYYELDKITSVKVKEGASLTRIGAYAFSEAVNLQEFQIPSTVKAVGDYAFNNCEKLESTIALADITVGENAFYGCGKMQGTVSLADTMTEIPAGCFAHCQFSGIAIPEGVTAIGKEAFKYAKIFAGADFILPATVAAIGEGSFYGSDIASIKLPEALESIGEGAFQNCRYLEGIDLPASLAELGRRAFAYSGMKQAVIPATVQKIGAGLFQACSSLSYVEFQGTGYGTDTLLSDRASENFDAMFDQTSSDLLVLCDGTTYDTLAGYAGTISAGAFSRGWSADILHKTGEYLAEIRAGYQAEKEAASALESTDYGEAAWNSLQTAITEAEAMLAEGPGNYEVIASRQAARRKLAEGVMPCLQDALDKTKAFLAGDSIEKDYDTESDSWWDLQDAVDDAERIIEENTADATEIMEKIQALKTAEKGLALRDTDTVKAALDSTVAAANALVESDYTPESWKALQDALAEVAAEKASGKISRIEAVQKKVADAVAALGKMPTDEAEAALEAAVAAATKDLKESDYTPESWKALQDALAEAEALKGTGTISQIQAAQTKVQEAAAALVKKGTGSGTNPSAGPSAKPSTDPSGNPGVKPSTAPGTKPTAKPQAPKVKKATVKKVKSTKKKTIQVQWKKISGVTGYQVQAALDKKFKKGKKTYTVKKAKTTKKTIKKLKSRKKYFVRVRAYKTVGGKKYYGIWSKVKSVKVK